MNKLRGILARGIGERYESFERRFARERRRRRLTALSPEILLWAMGLFCGFIGAFLLIAPHRFQTPSYEALLPYALAWGTLALASGMGLLAVAVLRPRRPCAAPSTSAWG